MREKERKLIPRKSNIQQMRMKSPSLLCFSSIASKKCIDGYWIRGCVHYIKGKKPLFSGPEIASVALANVFRIFRGGEVIGGELQQLCTFSFFAQEQKKIYEVFVSRPPYSRGNGLRGQGIHVR